MIINFARKTAIAVNCGYKDVKSIQGSVAVLLIDPNSNPRSI